MDRAYLVAVALIALVAVESLYTAFRKSRAVITTNDPDQRKTLIWAMWYQLLWTVAYLTSAAVLLCIWWNN